MTILNTNNNSVSLVGWYGGDRAIARAAWTSTQADVNKKTDEQIRDLLVNKLWNNGGKPHKTPFERGIVEFNIVCDAASQIHCIKHRLANINGESARYKELKDDRYLIPEDWGDIVATNLTGEYLEKHNGKKWADILKIHTDISNQLYHASLLDLEKVLGRKRAKESSRFFKTYNAQATLSVMMNMSCFHNFYCLRADKVAQLEIREIAEKMLECVKNIEGNPFRFTLEAFGI